MFALNFELLPRDTVCQRDRGQLNCLLPFCGISQDACNSGSCVPPVEALRHTKEMNTLPRPGAGRGSCGRWRKLQIDSSKMENENGKGKQREAKERKERKGFSKRSNTQVETVANRSEAKQKETKSKRIETDRKQMQSGGRRGVQRVPSKWQSGAGNLCREIEILNLPLHLSRISIWPRVPETDMIQATEWGGGGGRRRGWSKSGKDGEWEWKEGEHGTWDSTQGPAKHLIWLGTVGHISKLPGKKESDYQ